MEDTTPKIYPPPRASEKKIVRQALYSLAFIVLLAVISLGAYYFGTRNNRPTQVLGTETIATPTPYPTLPPIPTLFPTTPTPTPKINIKIVPPLKTLHVIPTNTPTPTPVPQFKANLKNLRTVPSATPIPPTPTIYWNNIPLPKP